MAVLAHDDADPGTCPPCNMDCAAGRQCPANPRPPEPASMCSDFGMDYREADQARIGLLLCMASALTVIAALAAIFI